MTDIFADRKIEPTDTIFDVHEIVVEKALITSTLIFGKIRQGIWLKFQNYILSFILLDR